MLCDPEAQVGIVLWECTRKEKNMGLVANKALAGCVLTLLGAVSAFAQPIGPDGLPARIVQPGVPTFIIPPSKLLHFDSAIRIPNQYMVSFKDDAALANDISSGSLPSLKIAPILLPDSADNIRRLANSISTTYQQKEGHANNILGVWTRPGLRGFAIKDVSEIDIAELAQDPRIEFIEPDMYAQVATVQTQSTGKPGCSGSNCAPWHLDRLDRRAGLDGLYHYDALGLCIGWDTEGGQSYFPIT